MSQKTIVCLYTHGGGMRGLIPALIMQRIEEKTGLAMVDMVDIFSGPSTGSILNAAINVPHPHQPDRPKYRARHLVRFYEREGRRIFPQDALRQLRGMLHDFNNRVTKIETLDWLMSRGHYDPTNLGRSLRALYGRTQLSDALRSIVIPVYNIGEPTEAKRKSKNPMSAIGHHAIWLKKITIDKAKTPQIMTKVSMFDAVMGSTAAPTYFPCHEFEAELNGKKETITAVDGSIFDSAPITYMSLLRRHVPKNTKIIMVVLGTGMSKISYTKDEWNRFGSLGVVDPANNMPLINIFFNASESALASAFEEELGDGLYVFNKSLTPPNSSKLSKKQARKAREELNLPDQNLDDASPENIERLKTFTETIIQENQEQFDHLCDFLVDNHKKRSKKSIFGS